MNRIRAANPIYRNYTGLIGMVHFTNGISDEYLPQATIDQLSAATPMLIIQEDDTEVPAGSAYRVSQMSHAGAIVRAGLKRQSEEERAEEDRLEATRASTPPVEKFYTLEELEEVADRDGIKGLRQIAEPWNVKSRAIPDLIGMILNAQREWLASHKGYKTEDQIQVENEPDYLKPVEDVEAVVEDGEEGVTEDETPVTETEAEAEAETPEAAG